MNAEPVELGVPNTDDDADRIIRGCLSPQNPKSFFLYAGAGSGKTRSLKEALDFFRNHFGDGFRRLGKQVAVITYTNAAVDEIAARVGQDPLFPISTIHSFCWAQIGTYHADIQAWLLANLPQTLNELHEKQTKGRGAGSKAAQDRERAIAVTTKRLEWLSVPRRFTYNPNGDNFGADSLSHAEVLKITSDFILTKPSMQAVLINKYPFLLIDESQDTSKVLVDALFSLAGAHKDVFALGLFGDTMQRIYADGQPDLGRNIPADWARPIKMMNHRSPRRIVQLGNALRADADGQKQMARNDSETGVVRLFLAPADAADKPTIEKQARTRMAEICQDAAWLEDSRVKTLTLEHHMAASRRGFLPMFQALDQDSRLGTGLRSGDLAGLRLFTELVAPLLHATTAGDDFGVMALLRKHSPLLKSLTLTTSLQPDDPLATAREAVGALTTLAASSPEVPFMDVLQCISMYGLFEIPASLMPFADNHKNSKDEEPEEDAEISPASLQAWRAFLETPFAQVTPYAEYVSDQGPFGTHQGVKGREFDRVLVVIDDSEARGFLFSFEKLLGTRPLSDQDRRNLAQGKETSVDRTRRLLYVTCTRSQKSLALVMHAENPDVLVEAVARKGWFVHDELETIGR